MNTTKPKNKILWRRSQNWINSHKTRAKKLHKKLAFSRTELYEWLVYNLEKWNYCCYCGKGLSDASLSIDHKMPTSRGGDFGFSNLCICCKECNEAKGALSFNEFNSLIETLETFSIASRNNVIQRLRRGAH